MPRTVFESGPRTGREFSEITKKLQRPAVPMRTLHGPGQAVYHRQFATVRVSGWNATGADAAACPWLHFSQEITSGWAMGCKGMGSSPEERKEKIITKKKQPKKKNKCGPLKQWVLPCCCDS